MLATIIALAVAASPSVEKKKFVIEKFYPAESALLGEQGNVTFRIRTNRKGQVDGCKVIASSGYTRLDEATCDMILRGATAKPLQDANGWRVTGSRDVYVEWRLPVQYAMGRTPAFDTSPGAPGTAYNCHRQMLKGSIIVQEKICVTDEMWKRQVEYAQAQTKSMQNPAGCGIAGGQCF